MVANIEEPKIWTPYRESEEFRKGMRNELEMFAKDAAIKFRCNPEELKFQVVVDPVTETCGYNFERMTPQEMDERKPKDG